MAIPLNQESALQTADDRHTDVCEHGHGEPEAGGQAGQPETGADGRRGSVTWRN